MNVILSIHNNKIIINFTPGLLNFSCSFSSCSSSCSRIQTSELPRASSFPSTSTTIREHISPSPRRVRSASWDDCVVFEDLSELADVLELEEEPVIIPAFNPRARRYVDSKGGLDQDTDSDDDGTDSDDEDEGFFLDKYKHCVKKANYGDSEDFSGYEEACSILRLSSCHDKLLYDEEALDEEIENLHLPFVQEPIQKQVQEQQFVIEAADVPIDRTPPKRYTFNSNTTTFIMHTLNSSTDPQTIAGLRG